MKPLEVLLKEEDGALLKPSTEEGTLKTVYSLFPYLKHRPFTQLLMVRGRLLRLQDMEASPIFIRNEYRLISEREQQVKEAISELE